MAAAETVNPNSWTRTLTRNGKFKGVRDTDLIDEAERREIAARLLTFQDSADREDQYKKVCAELRKKVKKGRAAIQAALPPDPQDELKATLTRLETKYKKAPAKSPLRPLCAARIKQIQADLKAGRVLETFDT